MAGKSVVNSDYGLDLVSSIIDYKGDIARNSRRSDGQIVYSPDFSPNNIRRMILSGDGVYIGFHVPVNGKSEKVRAFSSLDRMSIAKAIELEDYKPMIWALAERVCSSIEEVIICTENSSGINLSKELNFEGLVKNSAIKGYNIKESVSLRYKRLAYFTIANTDIRTLLKNQEIRSCRDPLKLMSDTSFLRSCSNITKFKTDWYNYYGSTSAYTMDNAGSSLNNHFRDIKTKVEASKRNDAIAGIKEERLKGVSEKFEKALSNYRGIYTCKRNLNVILRSQGTNYISRGIPMMEFDRLTTPDEYRANFDTIKSRDHKEEFIKSVTLSATRQYTSLADWFFSSLLHIAKDNPITTNVLLSGMERRIKVPPSCESLVSELGYEFSGVSMSDSTSNICAYACSAFISEVGDYNMNKYYNKDTWMKHFE